MLTKSYYSGPIHLEFGNCTFINNLSLSHNQLIGYIPLELCNVEALSEIENTFLARGHWKHLHQLQEPHTTYMNIWYGKW